MRTLLIITLPFLFLFASCEDEAAIDGASLSGNWQLDRATRNNMEVDLLDGLYFEFKEDGVLKTNLMGNTNDGTYTYDEATINTDGVGVNMTYTVKELTDSTLQLQSSFKGYQFGFDLIKEEK